MKTLRLLYKLFGRYRLQIGILAVLGAFGAVLDGIGINLIIPLFTFLIGGGEANDFISTSVRSVFTFFHISFTFRYLLVLAGALFVGRALVMLLFTYVRSSISADFMKRESTEMLSGVLNSKWSYILTERLGYIQSTLVRDVQRSVNLLEVVGQFIQSFTGFLMYLLVAINISAPITLSTLCAAAVLVMIARPLVRRTQAISDKNMNVEKEVTHLISEHVSGLKIVKAFAVENTVLSYGVERLAELRRLYVESTVVRAMGTSFIQPFSFIFIITVFAFVYKSPSFNLAAFAATLYLIQKIFVYLESTQSTIHSISDLSPNSINVMAFKERLKKFEEEQVAGGEPFSFKEQLALNNVSFSYRDDSPVLKGITLTLKKGEIVGLIGPSGGGKTSVADLLMRLFEPTLGRVELDGKPASAFNLPQWRGSIGYMSQDVFLRNDTIRNNISFYDDKITEEDIIRAAKQAYIYDTIQKLPEGLDTLVGERGVMLSVGQRQRIALARMLARKPEILILDEATSALDNESEHLIQQAIQELHGKVTALIIAHRLSTVRSADRIVVLDGGVIAEEGSPEELLKNTSSYFYRLQQGHEE